MNALDLIGAAGAAALNERLLGLGPDSGTARFMLDRLTGPQVAAIVNRLVADPSIQTRVKIAVPRSLVDGQGLPEAVITDDRTVALRHAECDRPALLIANTDDDQGASLHDVALIGAKELKEGAAYWVAPAAEGLGLFDPARTKILMLTHNAIAAERGYPNIARIFDRNEAFAKKEDAAIAFLADTVEPICAAYKAGNYGEMFRLMGGIPTIRKTADKAQWQADMDALIALRDTGTIGELIDHLKGTRRPRLSDRVVHREDEIAKLGPEPTEDEPKSLKRYRELRNVPYRELIAVTDFINGFTPFATQHSVKGAEFENVLVILSGGWNHYNWPQFFELLTTAKITDKNTGGFHRCRNLFYVAVCRPKKRLAVLATQALGNAAMEAVTHLFETENVVALPM